jgi:hypothetical protein
MSRQFFVGGNFKMNPNTREQKAAITQILNNAQLDPSTGNIPLRQFQRYRGLTLLWEHRSGNRATLNLSHSSEGDTPKGYPSCCAKLLFQELGCLHWRDQVGLSHNRHKLNTYLPLLWN